MRRKSFWRLATAVSFLALSLDARPAGAATLTAKLTADNAYQLWLGDANGVTSPVIGEAENCTSAAIFNGVETYNIPDPAPGSYLYLVAYSDDAGTQGVLGELTSGTVTRYTGDAAWEVFATGVDLDSCTGGGFPTAAQVDAQIAIANAGTGGPATSGTWVGTASTQLGRLAVGEDNASAAGDFLLVAAIASQARWMWFDAPPPGGTPFTTPNQKETLIFRLPVAAVVPCAGRPRGMAGWWPFDETSGTTAADLAGLHDGTHLNSPTPVSGTVDGALSFNGTNEVQVPDPTTAPLLDFGADEDFSIDFWIRTGDSVGVRSLLEKRENPGPVGYAVFLSSGRLALQLAEGGSGFCDSVTATGCTNYDSGITVTDNQWHFVAITVDRDVFDGIHFYLDGAEVVTARRNPLLRRDSLANGAPLRIGAHAFNGPSFDGTLDEVEIFNRALSDSEIAALFDAGPFGKCKDSLQPGWDYSLCPNEPTTIARPKVCNDSSEPHQYSLSFAGVQGGSPGVPAGCTGAGPTSFALVPPDALPLLVAPRTCREVKVTVGRPANHGVSQQRCYSITAQNLDTGAVVQSFSSVYAPAGVCAAPEPGNPELVSDPQTVLFRVRNPGPSPVVLDYELEAVASSMDPEDLITSLNDQPLGDRVPGQVAIPARGSGTVPVRVKWVVGPELLGFEAFNDQDVLLRQAGTDVVLASESLRPFAIGCTPSATELCLNGGRFRVGVAWEDFSGNTGVGQAVPLTADTGYFWFFSPTNVELVLKVLDGRPLNDHFWVFYGALSTVEYVITVTDTETGASKTYFNPSGNLASFADTRAIPDAGTAPLAPGDEEAEAAAAGFAAAEAWADFSAALAAVAPAPAPITACASSDTALCLAGGRFQVEVEWEDFSGNTGVGHAVPLTADTGYFWFFGASNVELILKVLDGRAVNQRWWVFYGALSSVEYTIKVTDTVTGAVKTYHNASGNLGSEADTNAFPP